MLSLKTQPRKSGISLEKLRSEGMMPAVFYGKKEASTPFSVSLADFIKVWKEAGETSIVTLKSEAGDHEALIQDIDFDPVTETPRHADFYVFEKGHKLEVDVPIEFEGTSPAVKDLGGILIKVLHELKVEAMPKDLPREIKVDISALVNFDSQIIAKDIKLPSGVELKQDPDEVVALVSMPKEEKEEEVPVDLSAIEVEKKGKKEEEGVGGDGTPSGGTPAGDSKAEAKPKEEKK